MHHFYFEEEMEHAFGSNLDIDDGIISVYLDAYLEQHPDRKVEGAKANHIVLYEERNGQYEKLYEPMKYE